MKNKIAVLTGHVSDQIKAEKMAERLNLEINPENLDGYDFVFSFNRGRLQLACPDEKKLNPIQSDFSQSQMGRASLSNSLIAKAVGIRKDHKPFILDACAGLAQDGFTFALLGCRVLLLERSPVVFELLKDAVDEVQLTEVGNYLSLLKIDALDYLKDLKPSKMPDVIYLDPMYPERGKNALARKEMRILRKATGDDLDASLLLEESLKVARERVVVKRRRLDSPLIDKEPDLVVSGKVVRFDVYKSLL